MPPQVSQKFISDRTLGIGIVISVILASVAFADFWHIPKDIELPFAIFLEITLYIISLIVILSLLVLPQILSRRIISGYRTRVNIQSEQASVTKIDYLLAWSIFYSFIILLLSFSLSSLDYLFFDSWATDWISGEKFMGTTEIIRLFFISSSLIYFITSITLGLKSIKRKPITL